MDVGQNLFGCEVLFEDAGLNLNLNSTSKTARAPQYAIADSILKIGLNKLAGPHKAIINFTQQNLIDKTPLCLPGHRIVIEVLEDIKINQNVISALNELARQNYSIALDDFVYSDAWTPLFLELADIVYRQAGYSSVGA